MCPKKQHSALWHLGCSILAVVWLCLGRVSITSHHGGRGSPQKLPTRLTVVEGG